MRYEQILEKYKVTQAQVTELFLNDNYENVPNDYLYIDRSLIEGKGVFSNRALNAGRNIGYSVVNGKRTQFGRFMNHSDTPNCEFTPVGNQVLIFTLSPVKRWEELTCDYALNIERIVLKK